MSKKQKDVKMNKNLLNAKIEQKFKKSFSAINIGFIVVTLICISNIVMYASIAKINVFTDYRGIIAIVLLAIAVLFNIGLTKAVARDLTTALVVPIRELQAAVHKIKAGEFDVAITYESQDELGELADDLREACSQMKVVVEDAGYLLGEMAEGHFNVSTKVEDSYVGDFQTLILGMRKLNRQLDGTLRQIREASEQVMVGSDQMA